MPVEGGEEAGKRWNNIGYELSLGRTRWFTCSTTLLGNPFLGCSFLGGLGNGAGCRRRVWDSETKKQRIPTANSFDVWPQRAAELVRNSNIQFLGFASNFEIKVKVGKSFHGLAILCEA